MQACDGRTDGRTDVKPIAITCFSIADARKNVLIWRQKVSVDNEGLRRLSVREFDVAGLYSYTKGTAAARGPVVVAWNDD